MGRKDRGGRGDGRERGGMAQLQYSSRGPEFLVTPLGIKPGLHLIYDVSTAPVAPCPCRSR